MSKPVNLNKVRKARARDIGRKQADQNAAKFGRTKAEKELDKARANDAATKLNAHRREPE